MHSIIATCWNHLKSSIPSNVTFLLGSALLFELAHMNIDLMIEANDYYNTNYDEYDYDDT